MKLLQEEKLCTIYFVAPISRSLVKEINEPEMNCCAINSEFMNKNSVFRDQVYYNFRLDCDGLATNSG